MKNDIYSRYAASLNNEKRQVLQKHTVFIDESSKWFKIQVVRQQGEAGAAAEKKEDPLTL